MAESVWKEVWKYGRRNFSRCSRCKDRLPPLSERRSAGHSPSFPVDMVYAWVDGADPAHAAKRERFRRGADMGHPDGFIPARFRNNNELLYSLRSLEKFAPWANHIYIVTDGQTPDWLDTANPRVTIVDHHDIIPEEYLPTFNSHVIESYLHRIPGLADQYVYFNDDFFLSAPCAKEDFFTANGIPYVFRDWRRSRAFWFDKFRCPHAQSYYTVCEVMRAAGISVLPMLTAHTPYPMSKACIETAVDFFGENIRKQSPNRFRALGDIAMYCHAAPLLGLAKRLAVPCDTTYYYIYTKRPDRGRYYKALLDPKERGYLPKFSCVNDDADTFFPSGWEKSMKKFLNAFLPGVSSFERGFVQPETSPACI